MYQIKGDVIMPDIITLAEAKDLIKNVRAIFNIHKIDGETNVNNALLNYHELNEIYGEIDYISNNESTFKELLDKYTEHRRNGNRVIVIGDYAD